MNIYSIPSHILIYSPENDDALNFGEINNYIKEKFGIVLIYDSLL